MGKDTQNGMVRPGLEKGEEGRMAGACEHCNLDTKEPLKVSLIKVRPQLDASGKGWKWFE